MENIVARDHQAQDYQIRGIDLQKSYNNIHAVRGNTFGVKKGKVLGLLGPNGAGKSTTFSIMALQSSRSFGEAQLLSQNIEDQDLSKNGKYFGFCPQYDWIFP